MNARCLPSHLLSRDFTLRKQRPRSLGAMDRHGKSCAAQLAAFCKRQGLPAAVHEIDFANGKFARAHVLCLMTICSEFSEYKGPSKRSNQRLSLGGPKLEKPGGVYSTAKSTRRLSSKLSIRPSGRVQGVERSRRSILAFQEIRTNAGNLQPCCKMMRGWRDGKGQSPLRGERLHGEQKMG